MSRVQSQLRSDAADGWHIGGSHESQSRTWENFVGRSAASGILYPKLQETFPAQLKSVSLDKFYRAINKVERSLIRTDADEVTYNLHVISGSTSSCIARRQTRRQRLTGSVARPVSIRPRPARADDRDGVLQDVHWYGGIIGGVFQGYTLGNILSAQFFEARPKRIQHRARDRRRQVRHVTWLVARQHLPARRKFTADELVRAPPASR